MWDHHDEIRSVVFVHQVIKLHTLNYLIFIEFGSFKNAKLFKMLKVFFVCFYFRVL